MRKWYEAFSSVRRQPGSEEHRSLLVSWFPEPGDPASFYRGLAFEPTGEVEGDEIVARSC